MHAGSQLHYARLDVRRVAARASNARGSLHDYPVAACDRMQVLPALTVLNALPVSLSLQMSRPTSARRDASDGFESAFYRGRLEAGEARETTSLAHSGLDRLLLIGSFADRQRWSALLEVPLTVARPERSAPRRFDGQDSTVTTLRMELPSAGEGVVVCVELRYSTQGAISALDRLTIFAPLWFINHSGVCLDHEELVSLPPSGDAPELEDVRADPTKSSVGLRKQPPALSLAERQSAAAARALRKMVSTAAYRHTPAMCANDRAQFVRFKAPPGSAIAAALTTMVDAASNVESEQLLLAISRSLNDSAATPAARSTFSDAPSSTSELLASTLRISSNSQLPPDALDRWSSLVQLGSFASGVPVQLGSAELIASIQRADTPVRVFSCALSLLSLREMSEGFCCCSLFEQRACHCGPSTF